MTKSKPPHPSLATLIDRPSVTVRASSAAGPWLACSLEAMSVAELVRGIVDGRRTGCLVVIDPRGRRELFFDAGQLIGAGSTHDSDRFGEVLWRTGRVTLEQVKVAAEEARKAGKLLGRCLVELGALSPVDLRQALVEQTLAKLEAACLEEKGQAVFLADRTHPQPIRFGLDTDAALKRAVALLEDIRQLEARLPLAVTLRPAARFRGELSDKEQAMLQIASRAGPALMGRGLTEQLHLGRAAGLRVLERLHQLGALKEDGETTGEVAPLPDETTVRVRQLCHALNAVMETLDASGFGVGDTVREYLAHPPSLYEEALRGLSFDEPLEPDQVVMRADLVAGGIPAVALALSGVLDDALMQAEDTLPAEAHAALRDKVRTFGVL